MDLVWVLYYRLYLKQDISCPFTAREAARGYQEYIKKGSIANLGGASIDISSRATYLAVKYILDTRGSNSWDMARILHEIANAANLVLLRD
jgi:hypothetical protein